MARSIWNGTITFGLAAVPIKVHSAVEDKGIHFHQVHVRPTASAPLRLPRTMSFSPAKKS